MTVVKTHGAWPEAPWKPLVPSHGPCLHPGTEWALARSWLSAHIHAGPADGVGRGGGSHEKQTWGFSQTPLQRLCGLVSPEGVWARPS